MSKLKTFVFYHYPNLKNNLIPDKIAVSRIFHSKTCDFVAETKVDVVDHKVSDHNWCTKWFSIFKSEENLKNHNSTTHKNKKQRKTKKYTDF